MSGKQARGGSGWSSSASIDGIRTVTCDSWLGCVAFLNEALLDYTGYVFRGHASDQWNLVPTLDRILEGESSGARDKHLAAFKFAARGRRGISPAQLIDENEWWALGQHNGLATPLLDWSESPYVAAFFAFEQFWEKDEPANRVVYALGRPSVEKRSKELLKISKGADTITFFKPMTDENSRLITQRGLFTRAPNKLSIEDWIVSTFKSDGGGAKLIKILVPSSERTFALRSLNRMNVNHMSLFPDLFGAGKYCNFDLEIDKY